MKNYSFALLLAVFMIPSLSPAAAPAPRCDAAEGAEQVCVGAKALAIETQEQAVFHCRYSVIDVKTEEGLPTSYCLAPLKGEACTKKLENVSRADFMLKVKALGDASVGDQVWLTKSAYANGNCGGKVKELYESGWSLIEANAGQACDWKLEWENLSQLL